MPTYIIETTATQRRVYRVTAVNEQIAKGEARLGNAGQPIVEEDLDEEIKSVREES